MVNKVKNFIKNRRIENFYKSNYKKNALVSYIVYPLRFKQTSFHNNQLEIFAICEILKELKFNVDVVFYLSDEKLNYQKYDLIFGFGKPFLNCCKKNLNANKIFYATGSHPMFQNRQAEKRLDSFYKKTGILMRDAVRFAELYEEDQYRLADKIIVLGNKQTKETYKNYSKKVVNFNNFFNPLINECKLKRVKNDQAKKSFLYLTSNGELHRGLDLLIEIFKERKDLNLFISSNINENSLFFKHYKNDLEAKNIHYLGFNKIGSRSFKQLISNCSFALLPTISEGQSTSMINLISCGLIPILTKEAGIDIDKNMIEIKEMNREAIESAINLSQKLSVSKINKMSNNNIKNFLKNYSLLEYKNNLRKAIKTKAF